MPFKRSRRSIPRGTEDSKREIGIIRVSLRGAGVNLGGGVETRSDEAIIEKEA